MKQSIDKTACCRTREKYSQKAEIIKSHCSLGFLVLLFSFIFGSSSAVALEKFYLADVGEPMAALVLPDDPDDLERKAAEEIIEHYRLVTGGSLQIVRSVESARSDHLMPICIGGAADPALDEASLAAKDNPSTFTLRITPDRVDIRGLSPEGTLFGAYELLEQLGFRWYMPGDLGRVVPDRDEIEETLALVPQEITQAPAMNYRRLQHINTGEWRHRVRLGGEARSTGAHSLPHPEYGHSRRRGYPAIGSEGGQVCVSGDYAPGALEGIVDWVRKNYEPTEEPIYVGMGPEDGHTYNYCQCEGCKALDQGVHDPFWDAESMTDRYIWLFNKALEELEDDYPNLHIAWYVYQRHMMPPKIEPNPRIVHVFAPITLDRIRGMDNPMSPDRHILRWLIDEWGKTNPNEMYYRGYYNNLACPQFPISQVDRVRHETPAFHENDINVMRVEVIDGGPSWNTNTPTLYLAARLMWDVETDVDALLEEFYTKFYGPAREPMKQYHEALDSAFADTPYNTGSSYPYFPIFKDHPRREQMRQMLDEAESAIEDPDSAYAERVRVVRQGWDRMEIFLDMIEARNRFDFATAHGLIEDFDRISDELVDHVLEGSGHPRLRMRMLTWRSRSDNSGSMFNRFFSRPINAGYQRAEVIGEIAAPLPDEWEFLLDPMDIGELSGYQRPGEMGGNWQPMKTYSRSWSDQGLHNYKGVAWYRTAVDIPEAFEGRPLYLWFGGVDNVAHVWINGEFVGTSSEPEEGLPGVPGSFRAFDMPATAAAKPGEKNWVVVKIENHTLAELGTGGILAPVMFWSPHDPDWQP